MAVASAVQWASPHSLLTPDFGSPLGRPARGLGAEPGGAAFRASKVNFSSKGTVIPGYRSEDWIEALRNRTPVGELNR